MSFTIRFALTLAVAVTVAACSSGGNDGGSEAELTKDGKVVIDVMSPVDPKTNMSTNTVTKLMSDKFKVEFRWQPTTFDAGPAKEKRQISLASGDYPDLFFLIPWVGGFGQAEVMKLGKQGVAVPLEGLIKEHAPNIQKALDSNQTLKEMATAPDGHIYAMPQWADCYHCSYPDKLWINSTWLKKPNLRLPKTTEDLRTVLRAFKTKDPNGNGKADEIPMTTDVQDSSLIAYLMGAFAYDPVGANNGVRSLLTLDGDKVVTPVDDPAFQEGLKYIHSLYAEGLIDPASFTQNAEALQAIGNDPKAVLIGSSPVLWPGIFVQLGSKDGRDKQYDAVPPLTGPAGKSYSGLNRPTSTGYTFMLTNKSSKEAQLAAIKMLDYIYTDEGFWTWTTRWSRSRSPGCGGAPGRAGRRARSASNSPPRSRSAYGCDSRRRSGWMCGRAGRRLRPVRRVGGRDRHRWPVVVPRRAGRRGATRLLVTVSSSTSAADWWASRASRSRADHLEAARRQSLVAVALGAEALLAVHLDDVRPLLNATSVRIGPPPSAPVDVA